MENSSRKVRVERLVVSRNHQDRATKEWFDKSAIVELTIDLNALIQKLGVRAINAKTRKATAFEGMLVVKAQAVTRAKGEA